MSKARERYEYCKTTGEPDFSAYVNRIDELKAEKAELIKDLEFIVKEYEQDIESEYGQIATRSSLLLAKNILNKYKEEL